MSAFMVWDFDPVLLRLGSLEIRYYGVVFAITILIAFTVWQKQMERGGHSRQLADRFFLWGLVGLIVGARLGHCFFYNAERYLSDPITILYFWKGGLASHGATVGLLVSLILFARKQKLSLLEVTDRFSMPAAIGAAGIRVGNFLNSEIVGRPTDVAWAVKFVRFERHPVPRHPSQVYEFALGLLVLAILVWADRRTGRESRPLGLLSGLFLTFYFAGRFLVEFVKEFHSLKDSTLTMGQYLSILPFLAGVALVVWSLRRRDAGTPA